MKESVSLVGRFASAIVGLVVGAISGMLVLYLFMLSVGSDFGLNSVRPGAVIGAVLGLFFALLFPSGWSWLDILS